MINFERALPTYTTIAFAMGTVFSAAEQPNYPRRAEHYEVVRHTGTHSAFMEKLRSSELDDTAFATEVASIYSRLAFQQRRMDADFERAIFRDLEGLYET